MELKKQDLFFDDVGMSFGRPEKNPTTYISPCNIPADYPSNCRKRKFETEFVDEDSDYEKKHDSDDGDIVTYVDNNTSFVIVFYKH